MNKARGSPRKFEEKIALLNKNKAETDAEFEKIIKEVKETTTRAPTISYPSRASSSSSWVDARQLESEQQLNQQQHLHQSHHHQHHQLHQQQLPQALHLDVTNGYPPSPLNYQQQPCDNRGSNGTLSQVHESQHLHHHHHSTNHHHHQHQHERQQHHGALHQQQSSQQLQMPVGVPNITIFPIDDDNYQQQVNNNLSYRNDCSNPISAARSLPDIANLKVSGSFSALSPSYSDQRIPSDNYDYNYDANSNIITDINLQPTTTSAYGPPGQTQTQTATTPASSWQMSTQATNFDNTNHQQSQSLHQNYYLQHHQSHQGPPLVRANSTNAVLANWRHTGTLNAPRAISNNLSKSSEVHYGYLETSSPEAGCYGVVDSIADDTQTVTTNPMMRSSSYNNIENIDFQTDKAQCYVQQQQQQQQHQQQQIFVEPSQCQFYE